jgi:SWIM zinc finger
MIMAEAYKETTIWADGSTSINHTYLLEGDRMIAYMRSQTSVPFYFRTPIPIDRRGRKFERLETNPFELVASVVEPQTVSELKEIEGSKGAKYYLNVEARTCTCPGFTYRGDCKHVKALE